MDHMKYTCSERSTCANLAPLMDNPAMLLHSYCTLWVATPCAQSTPDAALLGSSLPAVDHNWVNPLCLELTFSPSNAIHACTHMW